MNDLSEDKLNVLLVEDDRDFARNLGFRLSKQKDPPLRVRTAGTLREAMKTLEEDRPDVVLLDLSLPDSEGIDTYLKVHGMLPETPVVILSGYDSDGLAIEAVRQGAEDYLVKGEVDGKMIPRVIHYAIERHRVKQQLALVSRQLRETNLNLEKMTLLDPLTGLYNRRGFQQVLSREVQWAARHEWNLYAILMDIDYFKKINDTYGYVVGDLLLRQTAGILMKSVRLTDHVARIGGDEFVLLLPETRLEEALRIAERIRLGIAESPFLIAGRRKVEVTASIGLLKVPEEAGSTDALLARAHPFLKKSKQQGRNRISFEETDSPPADGEADGSGLLNRLRSGERFGAVCQPIVRLFDLKPTGYEMLARLEGGQYSEPEDFLRLALENNMLTLVDQHCFSACLRASSRLGPAARRHINLFPSTMIDIPPAQIIEAMTRHAPAPSFCIEISEQQIFGEPSYLLEAVNEYRKAGVRIALDDVGYGHSSLESLIALEPEIIKLDSRLVRRISAGASEGPGYLEKMCRVARSLGSEMIAEGIESPQDLETVRNMGIEYAQGFYLGVPAAVLT